jgi:DNA-directed RNA polymerase specialized sigma24 family protein
MHVVVTPPAPEPAPSRSTVPPALEVVYRQNARYVSTVALRLLGRDSELDDVVQDVFLGGAA